MRAFEFHRCTLYSVVSTLRPMRSSSKFSRLRSKQRGAKRAEACSLAFERSDLDASAALPRDRGMWISLWRPADADELRRLATVLDCCCALACLSYRPRDRWSARRYPEDGPVDRSSLSPGRGRLEICGPVHR